MFKYLKITLTFLAILILLTGCGSAGNIINILTDDISLLEIKNHFNSKTDNLNINIDFYNKDDLSIFSASKIFKNSNYDILVGKIDPTIILKKSYFSKIHHYTKSINNKNTELYALINDFSLKYNDLAIPYSIEIPVIICHKDSIPSDNTSDVIDLKTFSKYASLSNKNIINNYNKIELGFIPTVSMTSEIEYYFIFNSFLEKKNGKITFESSNSKKAFNFIKYFDIKYNYGSENTENYLKRYINIDKKHHLEKGIIKYDIVPLSYALKMHLLEPNKYKIFFIKGLMHASFNNKAAAILRSSLKKDKAGVFIEYLLSEEAQSILLKSTFEKYYYYDSIQVPVTKNTFNIVENLPISIQLFEDHINKLEHIDFINSKIQKRFFQNYNMTIDLINKGIIQESDFLNHFSNSL